MERIHPAEKRCTQREEKEKLRIISHDSVVGGREAIREETPFLNELS